MRSKTPVRRRHRPADAGRLRRKLHSRQSCAKYLIENIQMIQRKRPTGAELLEHYRLAREFLAEMAAFRGISLVDIRSSRQRTVLRRLRADFCRDGYFDRGLATKALAAAIARDPSTVAYHINPEARQRKNSKRIAEWMDARRRVAEASAAGPAGD